MAARTGRRGALSTIASFFLASVLLLSLYRAERAEEALIDSASIALENKRALYLARNVEETFWQTLAETAEACGDACGEEEFSALLKGNVLLWRSFWERELLQDFSGSPEIATFGIVSGERHSGRRQFSFLVLGDGFFVPVGGNRTIAYVSGGVERACSFSAGTKKCVFQ